MPDILTFADLKRQVLRTLERENDGRATAKVDLWVAQAEEDIAARVRAPWMMQAASTTLDEEWEEVPPGFIAISAVVAKYGTTWWPLQSASLIQLAPMLGQGGHPTHYCIENFSLTVAPRSGPVELRYTFWLREDPLLAPLQTNATLTRASGVYLYGACRHADVFYGDPTGLQLHDIAFERAVAQANALTVEWIGGDGIVSSMQPRRRRGWIGHVE